MRDQFRYMLKIGKSRAEAALGCFSHIFCLQFPVIEKNRGIFKSDQNRYSLSSPISVFALISACCVFEDHFPDLSATPQMLEHFLRAYRTRE